MTESKKPTTLFWVVATVALVWNIIGVLNYIVQAFMTEGDLKMLPTEQQDLINATPPWVTAAFAVAVWFGLLAAIAMLFRKKLAYPLFILSFLGIVGQQVYTFFISDAIETLGMASAILPASIFVLGLLFILYTKKSVADGILR